MEDRSRVQFQNNPELQRFVLPGVRPTGRQLGVGSYGSVEELEVNRVVCAGKRLHEALLEQGNAGVADIARKYLSECQVMAEMRHPHVVQFLGLCYLEGSALPVLVMERLDSSLDDLLETSPGLPLALKISLLTDVARGLLYLHTRNPPVVHRDLSARNVLLTSSLVAKISDLGNARIVNLEPGQLAMTQTRIPGTLAYMPPESFDQHSRYGPRLDIFSFGHLALFTLTQVFPGTLLPHTYPDPDNPERLLGRSEVERRADYILLLHQQLREQHPLLQLVCQCLHNEPAQRPSAEELLQQLDAVSPQIEGTYGSKQVKVEMARLQVTMMSVLRTRETNSERDRERLRIEVEAKDTQLQQKDTQLQQQGAKLQQQDTELQERAAEINTQQRELQTLREDRGRLQAEVEAKDAEIDRQQRELQALTTEVQQQLMERDTETNRLQREVRELRVQMDARSVQFQQQLQEKDDEINRLRRELRPHIPNELRLKWRRLPDMPEKMQCPHSVFVDEAVYVTAGGGHRTCVIHSYKLQTQQWTTLPHYQYCDFTMTVVNNQLTCVGGRDVSTEKLSNAVAVYSPSQRRWERLYPPMNTPRYWPAASTYHQHLVVAGGRDTCDDLTTVEVLNTSTSHSQWFTTTPLPVKCSIMTSAVMHDTLYILGGFLGKRVLSVSLPALIQTGKPPAQWDTLTNTLLKWSTAIAVYGALLAVGGRNSVKERSSAIHMYDEEKKTWSKVEDLPTERQNCTCCLLPTGEIFTAGGEGKDGRTSQVDVATVLN